MYMLAVFSSLRAPQNVTAHRTRNVSVLCPSLKYPSYRSGSQCTDAQPEGSRGSFRKGATLRGSFELHCLLGWVGRGEWHWQLPALFTYFLFWSSELCSAAGIILPRWREKPRLRWVKWLTKDHSVNEWIQVCVTLKTMPSLLCQAARVWQGDKKAIAHVFTYRKHPWLESMNSVNQSLVWAYV